MPRKSSIKTLPPEILAEVNRLMSDGAATLDEIVDYLKDMGHPRSRSALGRKKQQLDKVAEKLRRSREMANALVREIGPKAAEGKTGRLLVEILQSIAFDFVMKRAEGGEDDDELGSQDFFLLGKAVKEMAQAQKIDVDRELKIRAEVIREVVAKAIDAARKGAAKAGVTLGAEALKQIRRELEIIE